LGNATIKTLQTKMIKTAAWVKAMKTRNLDEFEVYE
jgi:hypothetical protein